MYTHIKTENFNFKFRVQNIFMNLRYVYEIIIIIIIIIVVVVISNM